MYKKSKKIFRTLTRLFILSLYCVLTFILYFQVDGPKCVQHSLHNAVMGCVHSRLRYRRARERLHFFLYLTYRSHKKTSDFIQFHQTLCITCTVCKVCRTRCWTFGALQVKRAIRPL